MNKTIPKYGRPGDEILGTMRALRDADVDWEDGKVWSLVFHAGDELSGFLKEAYTTFFSENALNPSAFPSLRRMEFETVSMTARLLGGSHEATGNMTSGGTESILMAVKTAVEWAKKERPGIKSPEMILPTSAHPAFEKAAHYFGIKAVHVPVSQDFRADVAGTRRAINRRTILIVGSAPSYPQGVVDPITALAALAKKHKCLCHVDACVGGFMLPFVRDLGYDIPPFDLSVDGVTSMSVDLHKYGYAAKGASVVLYATPELRKHQYFAYCDWPGGIYASPTMTGTRPGGAIAAAWAMIHRLGHEGYMEIAANVMRTRDRLRDGVNAIPGVQILGDPHMSVMAIGSDTHDVYEIGDLLTERGWHIDRQQNPASLHLTINQAHIASHEQFLEELRDAVSHATPVDDRRRMLERGRNILMKAAVTVLPKRIVSKATAFASEQMGLGDGVPQRSAAMYGLMASLPNRGDLSTMVIDVLDSLTRLKQGEGFILEDPASSALGASSSPSEPEAQEETPSQASASITIDPTHPVTPARRPVLRPPYQRGTFRPRRR